MLHKRRLYIEKKNNFTKVKVEALFSKNQKEY
jgi:hypothetical protein